MVMEELQQGMDVFGSKFSEFLDKYRRVDALLAQKNNDYQALMQENQQLRAYIEELKRDYNAKLEQYVRMIDGVLQTYPQQ